MDLDETIHGNEEVYRAIKRSKPSCVDEVNRRPTSALFKDDHGVSVDRQGERTRYVATSAMEANFSGRVKAIAMLNGADLSNAEVEPFPAPSENNIYHMELFGNKNKKPVTQLQALQLADAAILINWHDDVKWIGNM